MKDLKIGETYAFDAGGYLAEGKLIKLVPYGGTNVGHYGQFLLKEGEPIEYKSSLVAEDRIFTSDEEVAAHCQTMIGHWTRELHLLSQEVPA